METQEEELEEVIEHKIMKVNGEIGYKKYQRGKLLGKGKVCLTQVGSLSVTRGSIFKRKRPTPLRSLTRYRSRKTELSKRSPITYSAPF